MNRAIPAFLVSILILSSSVLAAPKYHVIDLGDLSGQDDYTGDGGFAFDVNNSGEVVGAMDAPDGLHGFYWSSSTGLVDLAKGWGTWKTPLGIGNDGQITLWADQSAYRGMVGRSLAAASDSFGWATVGHEPGSINDSGLVVGSARNSTGRFAYSWDGSNVRILIQHVGSGDYLAANGVNNNGHIVGGENGRAFLYRPGLDLAYIGDDEMPSTAYGINDAGQIIGIRSLGDGTTYGFSYTESAGMIDLGALGGGGIHETWPRALNQNGWVVGRSTVEPSIWAGFLWTAQDGIVNLNDLLDERWDEWYIEEARGINDFGWIAGSARGPTGNHAVVLVPVPEPGGILAIGVLAPVLLRRSRRASGHAAAHACPQAPRRPAPAA